MTLPKTWTLQPWSDAWSHAQIGVEPTGLKPYFINSFKIVIPAVILSTFAGAILAALPTLVVYIVSGRYFVRGLVAGAVKG